MSATTLPVPAGYATWGEYLYHRVNGGNVRTAMPWDAVPASRRQQYEGGAQAMVCAVLGATADPYRPLPPRQADACAVCGEPSTHRARNGAALCECHAPAVLRPLLAARGGSGELAVRVSVLEDRVGRAETPRHEAQPDDVPLDAYAALCALSDRVEDIERALNVHADVLGERKPGKDTKARRRVAELAERVERLAAERPDAALRQQVIDTAQEVREICEAGGAYRQRIAWGFRELEDAARSVDSAAFGAFAERLRRVADAMALPPGNQHPQPESTRVDDDPYRVVFPVGSRVLWTDRSVRTAGEVLRGTVQGVAAGVREVAVHDDRGATARVVRVNPSVLREWRA